MLLTDLLARAVDRFAEHAAVDIPPGPGRPTRTVLTFARLSAMADAVAGDLAPFVHGEAMVLVLLPRTSPWLVAAQIGVLRAGAAFVCVDPSHPDAHIAHVAHDAGPRAVLTDAVGLPRVRGLGAAVLELPTGGARRTAAAPHPRPPWQVPTTLAYAIYTSGTTGKPKGVLLEHAGVVNLITRGVQRFGLGPGDRVAQGSSAAYDSSIEESWLPLASGATLVVLDDATVRAGPDLAPWLRRERITVFCPPPTLLRAMDVRSPRDELPDLRLCYVGGEALPQDLADLWGAALWLENGYGPTECTVTVVRGRVHPGRPVGIGQPVEPHVAWLLDEDLQPVRDGEVGELCLAGPGLARGYLGLPDLTQQRFPVLPGIGRVYRTGDLARRGPDGELTCLGRIDSQVKVRGHRIELEAIESVLARCDGIREAACRTQDEGGQNVLVAHVVPAVPGPIDAVALAASVRAVLPEVMVPTRFGTLATLPRTIGGKVDRKALPILAPTAVAAAGAVAWQPTTGREQRLRARWAQVLQLPETAIGESDDFFALGGNSLRAAMLVSALRRLGDDSAIAVRDLYECPTFAAFAARVAANTAGQATATTAGTGETARGPASRAEAVGAARPRPFLFTLVQIGYLLALLAAASAVAWAAGFVLLPWAFTSFRLELLVLLLPWFAALGLCAYTLATAWLAVAAKELLIGRYQAGRWPAFSGFHARHWLVVRFVRLVPWSLLEGTEAKNVVLRMLGARIGQRVHVHKGVDLLCGGFDLLELGDDVTLQREVDLGLCVLDRGELVLGAVRIGAGATLATRAGTAGDVEIGAGAVVAPLAFVDAGARVPAGERWHGVPARPGGAAPQPAVVDVVGAELPPWWYTVLLLSARVLWAPLVAAPFTLVLWSVAAAAGVDGRALVLWLCGEGPWSHPGWVVATVVLAVVGLPVALVAQALALRWSPRIPAGTHARWSWLHLQQQVRTELLESAGTWLSGTLFWPAWLRLAGMRIGRDVEISTILDVLPEHTTVGGGSFLADGVYLGVPWQHGGAVTVAPTTLGERTFVGNHVVVAAGERLPDDLLLGIATIGDARTMTANTAWFGLPAFALPRREVVAVDRRLTHEPGPLRFANRVFWEALRVLLPALPVLLALWWFDVVGGAAATFAQGALRAAAATFGVAAALAGTVLVLKWLLLGRVRPGQHGLWSCWASRWDFHYVLWQRYGRGLLQQIEGTLLLPWFLRAMGMRIGRCCLLGDGFAQVVDPDMIAIGDGATVHALFQAHSFEDRVLKIAPVQIGSGATVGRGAVVLYGADIGDRAHVLPHSVVMKNELLRGDRDHAGAPTREVAVAPPANTSLPTERTVECGRVDAFDVLRGLAVLGMVFLHLLPEPDDAAHGGVVAFLLGLLDGVPAATFLLLAGVAWGIGPSPSSRYVLRRAAALVAVGVPFWLACWPNDVLVPMAACLLCVAPLLRLGRGALVAALVAVLVSTPCMHAAWGETFAADLRDDGTHAANHAFGLATLRWYCANGAYPLLPWLALPVLGALLARSAHGDPSRWRRIAWLALPLPLVACGLDALAHAEVEGLGDLAAHLQVEWQPTTLVFLLRNGGAAVLLLAGIAFVAARRGLWSATAPLAAIGRMSLTHYLLHTVVLYGALRLEWPAEDWPIGVGLAAFAGYVAFAWLASPWWLRRAGRGPWEAALNAASGSRGRAAA
ncbi:MAG: amino acid adenylation domain-containing protein [Planctomycetes bacterium]|nr:amino acid adenylation domain-containing protein [Planctomycetota bacterium]